MKGISSTIFSSPPGSAGVVTTAKSTSPFFTARMACGVEWFDSRSRIPGYCAWNARSRSDKQMFSAVSVALMLIAPCSSVALALSSASASWICTAADAMRA